jgi:ribosomal protein S9
MREGEEVDIDALMDSKAQLALLEMWHERRKFGFKKARKRAQWSKR